MKQWNTIKKLKVIPYKVFTGDVITIEDILNEMKWTDTEFTYNGHEMMIASEYQRSGPYKYIYVVQDNSTTTQEEYMKSRHEFTSMEDLIMNYKFDDGVSLIDFLTKPDIK